MTEDEQKFYDACAIAAIRLAFDFEMLRSHAAQGCFFVADTMLAERRKRMGGSND